MPREPSPINGAARAMAVVDFLAARPSETFSLSELARRVGLNKSTAHTVIHTLHDAGWLFQSPRDMRYGLGPRLTLIGQAAAEAVPEFVLARPIMHELASELLVECVFSALVADEIVVLGSSGPARLGEETVRVGSVMPCAPPLGTVFVAWLSEADRTQRRQRGLDHGYDSMAAELDEIRNRGYVATLSSSESWLLRALGELPGNHSDRSELQRELEERLSAVAAAAYLATHRDGTGAQPIEALMAPVFQDGSARYALTARLGRQVNLDELDRIGGRVRAAAAEISQALSGLAGSAQAMAR
jgi:DNA-binding IclR family transcriptional regulator